MGTNIGDNRLCVHINIDEFYKKALIFELTQLNDNDNESFDGFVSYNNFEEIGV